MDTARAGLLIEAARKLDHTISSLDWRLDDHLASLQMQTTTLSTERGSFQLLGRRWGGKKQTLAKMYTTHAVPRQTDILCRFGLCFFLHVP
jgi:hypothetical protein